MFGSEGYNYHGNLTIFKLPEYTTVVSTSGKFPSLLHKSEKFWGFDVFLEPPVSLIKGNWYYFEAYINGPPSFGGRPGNNQIESSGATFNFENRKYMYDGTGVEMGQLPEFMFSPEE